MSDQRGTFSPTILAYKIGGWVFAANAVRS